MDKKTRGVHMSFAIEAQRDAKKFKFLLPRYLRNPIISFTPTNAQNYKNHTISESLGLSSLTKEVKFSISKSKQDCFCYKLLPIIVKPLDSEGTNGQRTLILLKIKYMSLKAI